MHFVDKEDQAIFLFFQVWGLIAQMFSLKAPFINAEGVRGIKVCKKIPFFDVKIVRCLSGGNCKKL